LGTRRGKSVDEDAVTIVVFHVSRQQAGLGFRVREPIGDVRGRGHHQNVMVSK
jgi:hypothetical protein